MVSYLVLSYDCDSSSSIRIHAHTCNRESATATYETVLGLRPTELVELVRLSNEFKCVSGADVFWGNHAYMCGAPESGGYSVMRSNNREAIEVHEGESLDDARVRTQVHQ